MDPLRIAFMGSADLARPSLAALAGDPRFSLLTVVTQPDRPKGRDLKAQPTPVKLEAGRLNLPVIQPVRARDASFIQSIAALAPDIIVVVAYGQILPQSILSIPKHGCLNVHASLLPKYRGAAPIQSAILNDDQETGITIMKMDAGMDTGDILTQEATRIDSTDTAQTLHDRLARIGANLLVATIPQYVEGKIPPRPQAHDKAGYAKKLVKQDGQLDWTCPARALWNRVRALTPWPGAYTFLREKGNRTLIKVLEAEYEDSAAGAPPGEVLAARSEGIQVACGSGSLLVKRLQREGGRPLSVRDFLAGHPIELGTRLG